MPAGINRQRAQACKMRPEKFEFINGSGGGGGGGGGGGHVPQVPPPLDPPLGPAKLSKTNTYGQTIRAFINR